MKKLLLLLFPLLVSCNGLFFNKSIKFVTTADKTAISTVTKATFGDDYANFQRIVWEEGDAIRIASDHTTTPYGNYTVLRVGEQGERSVGKVVSMDVETLQWDLEYTGEYNFWSVYPRSAAEDLMNEGFNGEFSANIPNDEYLMVAHSKVQYGTNEVNLLYHPAFTTLRFSLISDIENVTLNSVKLTSNDYLEGDFTGTIDGIINNTSNITVSNGSKEIIINKTSVLSQTDGTQLMFFCLPQNINGVRLTCNFTVNGETIEKSLNLSYVFEASKQYRFYLKLNTNKELVFTDGLIEIVRCCSDIKYQYNMIRNMSHDQVKATLLADETLQQAFVEFIQNTTILHSQTTLRGNISASDFKAFKNLQKIEYIDMSNDSEIEMEDLSIDFAYFNHGIHYAIKDCQNLTSIKLLNINNNNSTIEIDNCNNIVNITSDMVEGNNIGCDFTIKNMDGLKTFAVHDGKSIHFYNCPLLESITMDRASRLETIVLEQLPKFKTGRFESVDRTVGVSLTDCGTCIVDGLISMKGNGNAVNNKKDNSNNILVRFIDNGNNIKAEF